MVLPSEFDMNESQKRKVHRFHSLRSEGKEFYYRPFPDILYADLNLTLTDEHLAMSMLRHLDKGIAKKSENIMNTESSKRSKIMSIARLVEGKNLYELLDASRAAEEEIFVPEYIEDDLRNLKPSMLTVLTDTPIMTADVYVRKKIDPLYNCSGGLTDIVVYGTELQHKDGVLTGEVNFVPDEQFRRKLRNLGYTNFLKKVGHCLI